MAELLQGWTTQANMPLGLRGTSAALNLAQDYVARFVQALLYTPNSQWAFWGDSDGAAVHVGPGGSLTAGDCLTINGVIVPFLSNGATGLTAAELMDVINGMNLPYITASLDEEQLKVESSGPDFQFGGNPATLTALGFDTTPTDSATTTVDTWPLALNSFDPEVWRFDAREHYSWVVLKATGLCGGADAYLVITLNPQGGAPFFDDPWLFNFSCFINMVLWVGVAPTNTTSASWSSATPGTGTSEFYFYTPWAGDMTLTGQLDANTDTFDDSDVLTDTDGSITGSGTTHRYIVLKNQPISQISVGGGEVVVYKGNDTRYGSAQDVYPDGKGRYIYLPSYSSAYAPIKVTYFTWNRSSRPVGGLGTPLQIVPRSRSDFAFEFARQLYLHVSVNENGGFTSWVSRVGDGFQPTECMSPLLNFTGYQAPPHPAPGLVLGCTNWRKDQASVSFSKSLQYPGMTQVASFLRSMGRVIPLGFFTADDQPNPFDLTPDMIQTAQFTVADIGVDFSQAASAPAMATSQRGTMKLATEQASENGIHSIADLLKLEFTAITAMIGLDSANRTVDAGQSLASNLDPLSGDAAFFDIPIWRIGVTSLLTADAPLGTEYRGTLDGIRWAPSTLTEGAVIPAIARDLENESDLIFLNFGDWDLSGATLKIKGADGVEHEPDISAVTNTAELKALLEAENLPGVGYRLLFQGLGLALTTTSVIKITAGGTLADQTHVDTGDFYGGCEQVKIRDCVIPFVTRQSPRL